MNHHISKTHSTYRCGVCHQEWQTKPRTKCPGIIVYRWPYPPHIASKTMLSSAGLERTLHQQPIGVTYSHYQGWIYLYNLHDARPKSVATQQRERQQAQLYRADLKRRKTCSECGEQQQYLRQMVEDLCLSCVARAEHTTDVLEHKRLVHQKIHDRNRMIRWAKGLLKCDSWVILDTETTCLENGYIVEIAIIDSHGYTLMNTRVNPLAPIEQQASMIHSITDVEIASAPTFQEIYPHLSYVTKGKTILAYNAPFDESVLGRELQRSGLVMTRPWICVMRRYAAFVGDLVQHDYGNDYRWQPLPHASHSALADCHAVLHLLLEMAHTTESQVQRLPA